MRDHRISLTGWTVRPATPADAERVAKLHVEAFPGFFLTELGVRFLKRMYASFAGNADAICLVAVANDRDGSVFGFVAGTVRPESFFSRMLRRQGLAYALDAFPALARHPLRVAKRLLRGLLYRGEKPDGIPGAALLSSLAVSPGKRGSGVAGGLVDAFCREVRARGASAVYLTTDRDENPRANAFYQRLKFILHDQLTRSTGRGMNRYVRTL
jgi:ribosomal protein S18 acetylase RimI-like enzyme